MPIPRRSFRCSGSGRSRVRTGCPADRTWSLDYPPTERLLYDVYSAPDGAPWTRRGSVLEQARMGGHFSRIYLQIPDSLQPDLAPLALEWTAGAASNRERADAILRRLRRDFEYSLEVGDRGEPLSLTDFLFRVRRGHCEYYATAMALLLRAADIPSRVVTGFLPGEWNSTGGYFIVRQRDAHSWVEAFLPEEGWVTYDATPPDTGFPLIRHRTDTPPETQSIRFHNPPFHLPHAPYLPGESDFTNHDRVAGYGAVPVVRGKSSDHREIDGGLPNPYPASHITEDVLIADAQSAPPLHYGEQHGQPLLIRPRRNSLGKTEVRARH